jgi:hypothetical protein
MRRVVKLVFGKLQLNAGYGVKLGGGWMHAHLKGAEALI